ncbi:MAG TPA: hypothetical protein VGE77_04295 [Nocardioides sp.]
MTCHSHPPLTGPVASLRTVGGRTYLRLPLATSWLSPEDELVDALRTALPGPVDAEPLRAVPRAARAPDHRVARPVGAREDGVRRAPHGAFYRVAGDLARDVDGGRPPYEHLVLPPLPHAEATRLCADLAEALGAAVAIVDLNDRGGRVRAVSTGGPTVDHLHAVLADNPLGQRLTGTPFCVEGRQEGDHLPEAAVTEPERRTQAGADGAERDELEQQSRGRPDHDPTARAATPWVGPKSAAAAIITRLNGTPSIPDQKKRRCDCASAAKRFVPSTSTVATRTTRVSSTARRVSSAPSPGADSATTGPPPVP